MEKQVEIIYGVNAVIEAVKSGDRSRIQKIIIADNRKYDRNMQTILSFVKKNNIKIEKKSNNVLTEICGTIKHQGIVGVVYKKKWLGVDELIAVISQKQIPYPTLVIADGIEDPGNLGALIRSAEALGIDGLIIPKRRAVGITPRVHKSSAGAVEHFPIAVVANVDHAIDYLKDKGFWIVAADAGASKRCFEINYSIPLAVVIGGEAKGIRKLIKKKCDFLVSVPMTGEISSLNLSAAGAIIFYEIARQRLGLGLGKK